MASVGPTNLAPSLWDEWIIARGSVRGWRDLGTYNPASRLPSGRPSDHAVNPSYAFDVGGDTSDMERFFRMMIGRPGVEYVIYNGRIWSRSRAKEGIRRHQGDPHKDHVHVSGVHISAEAQRAIAKRAIAQGGYSVSDLLNDTGRLTYLPGISSGIPTLPGMPPVSGSLDAIGNIPGADRIPGVGAAQKIADAAEAVTNPFEAIGWASRNWDRVLLVGAGFVLLLVGLILLGGSMGVAGRKKVMGIGKGGVDPVEAAFSAGEEEGLRSAARSAGRQQGKATYRGPSQNAQGIPY